MCRADGSPVAVAGHRPAAHPAFGRTVRQYYRDSWCFHPIYPVVRPRVHPTRKRAAPRPGCARGSRNEVRPVSILPAGSRPVARSGLLESAARRTRMRAASPQSRRGGVHDRCSPPHSGIDPRQVFPTRRRTVVAARDPVQAACEPTQKKSETTGPLVRANADHRVGSNASAPPPRADLTRASANSPPSPRPALMSGVGHDQPAPFRIVVLRIRGHRGYSAGASTTPQ